jgi:putative hydrolase of the HAD superfamily
VPLLLKAVIFDYGEVLSGPQRTGDVELMASVLGMEIAPFQAAYWQYRLAYDGAQLTPADYWRTVQADMSASQLQRLLEIDGHSWSDANLAMARWAARLHASGMTTAILSNMPQPVREYVNQHCTWLPQFTLRIFSCDARLTKPDAAIYRYCLDKLKLQPAETLFIDDKEANVQSARGLGMHAVHFRGVENLAADLQPYGDLEWGTSE